MAISKLIERQRRIREEGVIHVGEIRNTGSASFPTSRKTFRLTAKNKAILDTAALKYGGEVTEWMHEGSKKGYQLGIEQSELKAMFSAKELDSGDYESCAQSFEMWNGQTNVRRCDGINCETWQPTGEKDRKGKDVHARVSCPCLCDRNAEDFRYLVSKGKACKLVTRMRVLLTEIPALGLWRLNTGSDVFADEIMGFIEQLEMMGLRGQMVPVKLSIDFREKRTGPGQDTEKFPVVSVSIDANPVNLATLVLEARNQALSLPKGFADVPTALPDRTTQELPQNAGNEQSRTVATTQPTQVSDDQAEKDKARAELAKMQPLSSQSKMLGEICKERDKKQYVTINEAVMLGATTIEEVIQYAKTNSIVIEPEVV